MATIDPHTYVELACRCTSWQQAQNVADHLFGKRLIARANFMSTPTKKSAVLETDVFPGVIVTMETIEHYYKQIEREISQLLRSKAPALTSLPMAQISQTAQTWLQQITIPNLKEA